LFFAVAPSVAQETGPSWRFDYIDAGLRLVRIFVADREAKTGITVRVVAQRTGQALDTGRRGDADVVFVHAKSEELKFLGEGESLKRYPV